MKINWLNHIDKAFLHKALQVTAGLIVAILITHAFNTKYNFWVFVTIVVIIQANIGASIKRAKDRVFGTILGVLTGVTLLMLFANTTLFSLIVMPILIFLTIYLYNASYVYAIYFGSILLMVLIAHGSQTPWQFAYSRIFDTLLGVTIGLIATYCLWPNGARNKLHESLSKSITTTGDYFKILAIAYLNKNMLQQNLTINKVVMEEILLSNHKLLTEFSHEPITMKVRMEAATSIVISMQIIYDVLMSMTIVLRNNMAEIITVDDKERITDFIQQIDKLFAILAQMIEQHDDQYKKAELSYILTCLDQHLIEQEQIKDLLVNGQLKQLNILLFVYNIKKIAVELKYITESIQQFLSK